MDSKWREKQIKHARERFKDFVADFNDYGDIQTLDWRHKDGGSDYHVHYIFDTKQQYMHISGDLGSACFYLTWEPTFENMRNRIRDPWYIIGKLECSTDKYAYPDEYVRSEIEEYYKDWAPARDDYDEGEDGHEQYLEDKEEFWETIESFIQAHDRHYGFQEANCDRFDELQEIDGEWYEHEFGRCISTRVYCWLVGLEMAWENYVSQERCTNTECPYYKENCGICPARNGCAGYERSADI